MGIEDLPAEIFVHLILVHLTRQDLSSLSKTSKKVRNSVEPTLYREIPWRRRSTRVLKPPPIHLLVRTLLARPDLRACIKIVRLSSAHVGADTTQGHYNKLLADPSSSFTDAEMEALESLIRSLHNPSEGLWLYMPERCEANLFIAVLINHLSSLDRLSVDVEYQWYNDSLSEVLADATTAFRRCTAYQHFGRQCGVVVSTPIGV